MNQEFMFTILEKPVPQARHRHNYSKCYDPQYKIRHFFRYLIKQAFMDEELDMFTKPTFLTAEFYLPIPKTKALAKKKGLYHTSKSDLDNLLKFILDCMTGIVYKDDSIVCKILSSKMYSQIPRVKINIKEIDQEPIEEA